MSVPSSKKVSRSLGRALALCTGAASLLATCRLPGPALERPDPEIRVDLPGVGTGVGLSLWRFQPGNAEWADLRAAELVLSRSSYLRARAEFELRLIARNADGALRIKTWSGTVSRKDDVLDLHAERCYVFGKRDFADRLVPLDRWDCDHLSMRFRVGRTALDRLRDDKRTTDTDWFYLTQLRPLVTVDSPWPTAPTADGGHPLAWAGQRLAGPVDSEQTHALRDLPFTAPQARYGKDTFPGGVLGEKDGAVYFGYNAHHHLRPGDRLLLFGPDGRPDGSSRVLHVVGDFVLVQEARPNAPLAGTSTSHKPKGLFD